MRRIERMLEQLQTAQLKAATASSDCNEQRPDAPPHQPTIPLTHRLKVVGGAPRETRCGGAPLQTQSWSHNSLVRKVLPFAVALASAQSAASASNPAFLISAPRLATHFTHAVHDALEAAGG